jgi:RNA polymerase sigma-70 factor (ECF subfamily)
MQKYSQNGDPKLIDALIVRHGDDLYHFLLSLGGNQVAADLAQSTWLRVMEKRRNYHPNGQFKAWLFTLARNLLIDHLRVTQRNNEIQWDIEQDEHQQLSQTLTDSIDSSARLALFNQILAHMPLLQKEAFMLQQEGFSLAQIAQITTDNHETIKSRLRYARSQFEPLLANTTNEVTA